MTYSITKTLSAIGQGFMKTLQEAKIGETLQSGVSSVKNKLNDPNFQKDVKDKAEAGWSWLSSTAGSLWSAANEAASQIASDLNEPAGNVNKHNSSRPAGGVSTSTDVSELTVSPQQVEQNSDIENDEDWMARELAKAK